MRELPDEGRPSQHHLAPAGQSGQRQSNRKVEHYRVQIKKISKRLNAYADGANMPANEVMNLLQDTRSQILSMHIARENLRKHTKQHKKGRNRKPRHHN